MTYPPFVNLSNVSVSFPVPKHNLDMGNHLLARGTVGGLLRQEDDQNVSVGGLTDINLRIERGERVGFFGVNGAGKTTILKVIAGLLPPSSGTVSTVGRVTSLLNIGLGVDGEMSGYENLLLRMIYDDIPTKDVDEIVENILEFSELGEFFYLPFKTYSSGMRARLLLALSTLKRPDVLIMDEWISAGDEGFRTKASERLQDFVSTSGALILASHSKSLLEEWTTRGIWLDKGSVVRDGPTSEVLQEYIDFVKSGASSAA